jgi:hypothetical protein
MFCPLLCGHDRRGFIVAVRSCSTVVIMGEEPSEVVELAAGPEELISVQNESDTSYPKRLTFANMEQFKLWFIAQSSSVKWNYHHRHEGSGTSGNLLLATYYYHCHRAGKPRVKVTEDERKRMREQSIKVGCTARLNVSIYRNRKIAVTWYYRHQNHDVDMSKPRLNLQSRTWLADQVINRKKSWEDIKRLIRPHGEDPLTSGIEYMDYYNLIRSNLRAKAYLDSDLHQSLTLWIEKITTNGGWGFLVAEEESWAVGFATKWQKELLAIYGETVCLGSTFGTCFGLSTKDKPQLYSFIVRDELTDKEYPAAFLITNDDTTVSGWLLSLVGDLGFHPRSIVIDCSDATRSAIEQTLLDNVGSAPTVRICQYHLLQDVKLNFAKVSGDGTRPPKKLRSEAMEQIKLLVYETDEAKFWTVWDQFQKEFQNQRNWVDYFNTRWMDHTVGTYRLWSSAYGPNYFRGDSNNPIENWQGVLKEYYLERKRSRRVDVLIEQLVDEILPDVKNQTGDGSRRVLSNGIIDDDDVTSQFEEAAEHEGDISHISVEGEHWDELRRELELELEKSVPRELQRIESELEARLRDVKQKPEIWAGEADSRELSYGPISPIPNTRAEVGPQEAEMQKAFDEIEHQFEVLGECIKRKRAADDNSIKWNKFGTEITKQLKKVKLLRRSHDTL